MSEDSVIVEFPVISGDLDVQAFEAAVAALSDDERQRISVRSHGGRGSLRSIDPSTVELILELGGSGAVALIVRSVSKLIMEWQRSRNSPLKIRVGDVALEIPPRASAERVAAVMESTHALLTARLAAESLGASAREASVDEREPE